MKITIYFRSVIFLLSLSTVYCCEQSVDQTTTKMAGKGRQFESRTVDDCGNCPNNNDCCCSVELQDPDASVRLQLCGTSDGASACSGSAVGNCSSFSGGGQQITLDPNNTRDLFCMVPGNSFWIENLDPSNTADIYLSCQYGLTSPQILTISIPAGQKWYYSTNSGCSLTLCQ